MPLTTIQISRFRSRAVRAILLMIALAFIAIYAIDRWQKAEQFPRDMGQETVDKSEAQERLFKRLLMADGIPVATDQESLKALLAAATDDQLPELVRQGRVFMVGKDTSVRVIRIAPGGSTAKIRTLTGPQKDRAGWIPSEWAK